MSTLPNKKYKFKNLSNVIKDKLLKHNPSLTDKYLAHLKLFYKFEDILNNTLVVGTDDGYFKNPVEKFEIKFEKITIKDVLEMIGIKPNGLYLIDDKDTIINLLPEFISAKYDENTTTLILTINQGYFPNNLLIKGAYKDGYHIPLLASDVDSISSGILLINSTEFRLKLLSEVVVNLDNLASIHGFSARNPLKLSIGGDLIEEIPTS